MAKTYEVITEQLTQFIEALHGRGEVVTAAHADFDALVSRFPRYTGTRSVIRIAVERVADSCGYGVPCYRFDGERRQLLAYAERKGPEALAAYRRENNATSIDRLSGLE